ncbi:alpha/beta hydrolase [Salegentibacter sp. JZCK2]|uniref:alpha/beta fold hydrolase n=1 Tax=Salegentibacter tibetensis TaxID=2873600 RepID=UPI001CCFF42D|nr:alpha/beta hydrolase [Salegentibacter tibetensis]MBZ9731612.1 alpha/beta hydrolase [Salegentibacter tibetensis]
MKLKDEMSVADFVKRQQHINLDGIVDIPVNVAYTDIGQGEPVILLHGIPTWSYLYNNVIDAFGEGYRVIAPDFLGHGYSDQRDLFDRSIEVQARMVLRLMQYLNLPKAHIIGHDTGGGVSLIMAIKHREIVDKLVLSNIVAYDSWPIDDMLALGNPQWASKTIEEIADFLLEGYQMGLSNPERLTENFKKGIRAPYLTKEGKISLIRNASSLNTNHTTSLVPRHQDIISETLLLWGIDDPWQTITDGRRLQKEISNSRLIELEKTSHWLQQDNPERYTYHILEFLNNK